LYDKMTLSEVIGDLEHHVRVARKGYEHNHLDLAQHLVEGSIPILAEIVRRLGIMAQLDMSALDRLREQTRTRLINHFGLEGAIMWLERSNDYYRPTPAEHFAKYGEGAFLDATCEWPLEDKRRAEAQATL
jgi:hypothetical protein